MNKRATVIFLALAVLGGGVVADAAEVKVISANGMRDTMRDLREPLERATGQTVTLTFGEAGNLRRSLQAGDTGDVIILPRTMMDQALGDGKIAPGTTVDLARTEVGAGVRAGAAKPDMSSADGFTRALLAAKAIVITDPATGGVSGVHMADVFRRLGIAEQVTPKLKLNAGGYNAEFVAKGDADIAFQLAHEVRAVPGIEFIPLPAGFQRVFVFSAALGLEAKDRPAAKAVMQFLSGPAAAAAIRADSWSLSPVSEMRSGWTWSVRDELGRGVLPSV